jgi:protein-tyrosine sulfotransferase
VTTPEYSPNDLKKYLAYFFETKGFTADTQVHAISDRALRANRQARGVEHGPAVMIHGIMPRSGTVYVGELLRRHPALYAYPHQLWEVPALQLTGDVHRLQDKFLLGYKPNAGKLGGEDFVALFGAAILAYLHEPVPAEQRLLIKMPSVQYLSHFFAMFPHENLLILTRDGRDLVHSTLRTWPHLNLVQVCLRWDRSAKIVLSTMKCLSETRCDGHWMVRYEDALRQPDEFVREACQRFDLDVNRYPFEMIDSIKVIGSSKLEKNVGWRFIKRPKNFAPVDYWKEWSALRKIIFKAIAGRSLIELGYSQDSNW